MVSLADMLYDLIAPPTSYEGIAQNPAVHDAYMQGAVMPPDPRMQAYRQQMAQAPQAPPQAPQAPPQPDASWADALYKLVSPAMGGARAQPRLPAQAAPPGGDSGALDAVLRSFLPNTYKGGTPQTGAPNPFTPPLWRDPNNPDDPLNRRR